MVYNTDKTDMRILFELDRNARIPETKLAKIIHKSKEAVRYRIKRMMEEKIILGFTTWVDPVKLGYQTAKVYLNLANLPERKKQFIEYVKKDGRLFWLGLADGVWNAGLTFFVKSNQEFFSLKNELVSKFADLIIESKTAFVVSVYYKDKTFIYDTKTNLMEILDNIEENKLDDISKKILGELYHNSRCNIAFIAHKYHTSVDIVRNRMGKMKENKIISKYTIDINYDGIGFEFYKAFLYFKDLNESKLKQFMNFVNKQQNIINLVKQISSWDLELEIMCKNYKECNKIISDLTYNFPNIIKIETSIISEDYVFPAPKTVFT